MSIRPKTKRRLLFLGVTAILVVGATAAVFKYRLNVAERRIQQEKTDGLAAYAAGDFPNAIKNLSEYVTKHKDDPDALLPFGIARSKVPSIDGSHITQAINLIRIYTSLRPADIDTQHLLLQMQTPLPPYAAPALLQANDLLQKNPGDLVALKTIVEIAGRSRKYDDAWTAAQKYTELDPTDLEVQEKTLYLMQQMGKPASELRARADALVAKFPNDPRFLLVQASALSVLSPTETPAQRQADIDAARKLVVQAAGQDPPDVQFVRYTITQLDHIGQYNLSQNLLERAVAKLNDPELMQVLVQRLWENHKFAEVVSRLGTLDPASPTVDVQLAAYKALALFDLNKKPEADALVANLASRKNDGVANAWSLALRTHFDESNSDIKTQLANYRTALESSGNNAVIETMLGDAYAQIGENELALQSWRAAANEVPSWAEPHIRIAEVLASEGQGTDDEAMVAAQQALLTTTQGPHTYDPQGAIAEILVDYTRWQSNPDPLAARQLLENLAAVQSKIPGEANTLPLYAAVLAQTGDRAKAIEIIKGGEKQSGPSGEAVLLKLARVSRIAKLGLETEIFSAIEQQYGLTPRLAFARATGAMQDNHADQGLKILQDAKTQGTGTAMVWERVICQYRELAKDPGAARAWETLGDAYPGEISIQSLIVSGEESAWGNRDFMDRSINRLKDLTGDQASAWKTARARWLLSGDNAERDASAAVVLLNDVVKNSTTDFRSRMYLALAFEKLKNRDDAAAQWQQVAILQPNSPQILLSLLRALHAAGKFNDTRLTFDKLGGFQKLPPDVALQAAAIMAQEGNLDRASAMLEANPNPGNPVLHDGTLAKVYRLQGRTSDAAALYFKLEPAPSLDVQTIEEAADFFGSQHDLAAAHRFLNHADASGLPADQHDVLLADFDDNWGNPTAAAKEYADAVAAGSTFAPSAAQIGFFLRHQKWTDARLALDAAMARWPDNSQLKNLQMIARVLTLSPQVASQTALVKAISQDPQNPAGQETLALISQVQGKDANQILGKLQSLIDKYPDFLPLYELTIPQLLRMGRTDEAINLAGKIMTQFSTSVDAARIATQSYAIAGRWSDAIAAAQQWRQRDAAHPLDSDEVIAWAQLHTNQPREAADRLAPYIPAAREKPDANENLLLIYAQTLIRAGSESDAADLLLPLAKNSPKWRADWLRIAVFPHADGPSAAAWIEQVRPLLDPKSLEEQQHLADAYFDTATQRDYPQGFAQARDALKPFVTTPQITVAALMTYASAADNSGDEAGAEGAYREALRRDDTQIPAKNNLAEILRKKGDADSLKEAEKFARAAVASNPTNPSSSTYYDTLARVLLKANRPREAQAVFESGYKLQPKDLNILIGLASIAARDSRYDAANNYLLQISAILSSPNIRVQGDAKAELDSTRDLVQKATAPSSVSGTDPSPGAK